MNPLDILMQLKKEAERKHDPLENNCILATVDFETNVFARTIQLHSITSDSLTVIIDRTSPKYSQLNETGKFELLIIWKTIPVQIRIKGIYIENIDEDAEKFWQQKSYKYKLLDHYHSSVRAQSEEIDSREVFEDEIEELTLKFSEDDEIPMPDSVTALNIIPERIEIWSEEEFPHRSLYTLEEGEWKESFLTP